MVEAIAMAWSGGAAVGRLLYVSGEQQEQE
jgi:hypothetical protein